MKNLEEYRFSSYICCMFNERQLPQVFSFLLIQVTLIAKPPI